MSQRPVNPNVDLDALFAGSIEIIGRDELEQKIRAGRRLVIKHGVDPTARDLHLGYAVNYQVMRRFQDAGHTVVLLIGDYTCRIGDPTGRDKTRPRLTPEDIEANVQSMLDQVDRVLDTETLVVRRNSEWFDPMPLAEFLNLGTRISAARLWERDMFQRRLEKSLPVYVHEFLYPVLQGFDSYMLKSDVTVNGSDQKFNELMGREIQQIFGQQPQAQIIMPMLAGTDGVEKMSQSLGNYIGLAEPADDQYGKVLSIPDELMANYFQLATRLPPAEISEILSALEGGRVGPMATKMRLAREIVSQYHDEVAAQAAEARFIQVHRERALPDDIPEHTLALADMPMGICSLVKAIGMTQSMNIARQTVRAGGLRIDGEVATDERLQIDGSKSLLLQKGKRHFARVHFA